MTFGLYNMSTVVNCSHGTVEVGRPVGRPTSTASGLYMYSLYSTEAPKSAPPVPAPRHLACMGAQQQQNRHDAACQFKRDSTWAARALAIAVPSRGCPPANACWLKPQ